MSYVNRAQAIGSASVAARLSLAVRLSSVNVQAQQIKKIFVIAMENHNWNAACEPSVYL